MDTLFSSNERVKQLKNAPLAVRMRPSCSMADRSQEPGPTAFF